MGRQRIHESDAARVAAHRAKKQCKVLTVELPDEVWARFNEYLQFKGVTKSAVIEKLITSQLLRKR